MGRGAKRDYSPRVGSRSPIALLVMKGLDMTVLMIRHQVRHYETWKAIFDEEAIARHAYGSRRERVYRDHADAGGVLMYLEWDDAERARLFVQSDELRDSMIRSGVADWPDIWILNEVHRSRL